MILGRKIISRGGRKNEEGQVEKEDEEEKGKVFEEEKGKGMKRY